MLCLKYPNDIQFYSNLKSNKMFTNLMHRYSAKPAESCSRNGLWWSDMHLKREMLTLLPRARLVKTAYIFAYFERCFSHPFLLKWISYFHKIGNIKGMQ